MASHRPIVTLIASLFLIATVVAQPFKLGCHYYHNLPVPPHALTDADRAAIDDVIARSDTFDIEHYDIAADVTDYAGQMLRAATTITFKPRLAGQNTIRFDLEALTVDSVRSIDGINGFTNT